MQDLPINQVPHIRPFAEHEIVTVNLRILFVQGDHLRYNISV